MVQIGALVAELEVCKDCGNRVFSTLSGFNRPKSAAALRAAALLGRLSSLRLGVHKGASCFGKDSSRLARGGGRTGTTAFPSRSLSVLLLLPSLLFSFSDPFPSLLLWLFLVPTLWGVRGSIAHRGSQKTGGTRDSRSCAILRSRTGSILERS